MAKTIESSASELAICVAGLMNPSRFPGRINRVNRPMTIFVTVVLWVAGLLAIWTLGDLLVRLTGYLWRPDKIVIGEFVVDGQASPTYATKFHDRWLSFRASGQALDPVDGLPTPGGTDFILAEVEQRSASDLERVVGDLGKDLDLKVAGMSLQVLTRFLDGLLRHPQRMIEGRISRYGNEICLTVALHKNGEPLQAWTATRTVAAGKTSDGQAAAEEALIDDAICEVALYVRRSERLDAKVGGNAVADSTEILTARAFAELKKGRRSMERYALDNQQDDLLAAQQHFRSVVASSPAYTDGYLLLSQSLAENRQEHEAVEIYDQALRRLRKASKIDERRVFEARFLKASSLLRCYRWADLIQAISEFANLARDLETRTNVSENRYMLARTHAEYAHCIAHLLILLPKDRSIPADYLKGLVPVLKAKDAKDIKDPGTLAGRRKLADRLYALAQEFQAKARQINPIDKEEWKGDLEARLCEVRGYAQYRRAEWLPATQDGAFREQCTQALRSLQEAELAKPRHYSLLQSIGMVYLNRRYDPQGEDLERAEHYCQRSVELKPGDYYGYEQLTRTSLRRALLASSIADRDHALKLGEERLSKAIQLRPDSIGSRILGLYMRLLKLGMESNSAKVEDLGPLLTEIEYQDPDGTDLSRRWMRLACGWFQLRTAPDEKAFNAGKTELQSRMDTFVRDVKDKEDAFWRVAQMRESIKGFQQKLKTTTYAGRFKLSFDLGAALD